MESKTKLVGHSLHPMLVVFPLGLLLTSILFDVIGMISGAPAWFHGAFWMIAFGILGGLTAAVFGLVDWLAIPAGTRAKRIGAWHGGGNVLMVVLFLIGWLTRIPSPSGEHVGAFVLSCIGGALALVTGWLGGALTEDMAVGINEGANLNAPSGVKVRGRTPAQPGTGIRKPLEA